jgi:hypothetical protein
MNQQCRCALCGEIIPPEKMTKDHIVPTSKGGSTEWDNIQLTCEPCNAEKADSLLVEGLTREQFGQQPRIVQWAIAGKHGIKRTERIRDARQEKISWSLGKTPGGTGGDPAPHSFYSDDRNLFDEIVLAEMTRLREGLRSVVQAYPSEDQMREEARQARSSPNDQDQRPPTKTP